MNKEFVAEFKAKFDAVLEKRVLLHFRLEAARRWLGSIRQWNPPPAPTVMASVE